MSDYRCECGGLRHKCDMLEIDRLRAGIIKARDALDNYDQDTSLFDIMNELDELLGDTE